VKAVEQLLLDLNNLGIKLWLDGDRLGVNAPKGVLTEELRVALAQHKEHLLFMLREMAQEQRMVELVPPQPQARFDPFPLMDVQHAYWIGRKSLVESGGVSTHLYLELERVGLDVERLNASLQKVIDRHDMLRAIIQSDGQQRILKDVPPYRIEVEDLSMQSASKQDAAIERTRQRMSHQVLPCERWPLFEFFVSLLDGGRVRLHCSLDMLILDASSMFLLFSEWKRYYDDSTYSPRPIEFTYRDYALAEQALQEGELFQRSEKYWLDRLDALLPPPDLPLATQPEQLGSSRFTRRRGCVARPRWEALKRKAQVAGLTPSALLAAAFGEVLRLWSKEPDFTLNVTLFQRLPFHPQVSQIIGDFTSVNLLSMPAFPGESFVARASRLQVQLSQDLEHLHYNGVRVLRERARRLGSGLRAAMPIVFTSALGIGSQGHDAGVFRFFGDYVYGVSQTPQVWLDHQVAEQDGELIFNWDVVEGLFPAGMIDDMFESFSKVLEELVDDEALWNRTECVAKLPGWQLRELAAANATYADIPEKMLHELVATQAHARPDAIAVIADDICVTYGDLSKHANRLGRYLRDHGAGKGQLVAIAMEKGWEQVAGVLGILHAGAAYLPIDPDLPQERRSRLLACGESKIVVTQSHLRTLSWPAGVIVVALDDDEVVSKDSGATDFVQGAEDLAYVIFTSGSTGEPKGVMIDHRGAANTVQDINRRFGVNQDDRLLALSALSFDLSVYDIFGVLGAGGCVVIPSQSSSRDPGHWNELIERHKVTLWNSVPQLLQLWVDYIQDADSWAGCSLRHVQLSGDWIPVKLPDQVRALCPGVQVVSLGGATEASIWSIGYPIEEVDPLWKSIPYGMPLANQRFYIFNSMMEHRALWVTGEIYIGGVGVAQGYWRDRERTVERFVHHPSTGERLYKTGDLGCYLPGGVIEFLGREDFQVKINGYRIELGEVTASLLKNPAVQQAFVTVAEHPQTRQKQLVAYVVPKVDAGDYFKKATFADFNADGDVNNWQAMRQASSDVLSERRQRHAEELRAFDALWRQVEDVSPFIMARTLLQLGAFQTVGQSESAESIVQREQLEERHRPIIDQWLKIMSVAELLACDGPSDEYRCVARLNIDELNARIERDLSRVQTSASYKPFFDYIKECAAHQVELVKGELNPLALLFPDGESYVADALYRTNPVNAILNEVVANALRAFVEGLPNDKQIRVLEVGAGTGATTVALLPALPVERTRYCFTDISSFFLDRARQRFMQTPFMDYGLLDIDRSPSVQGYARHSFDVIVAVNVLHDAKDIDKTLEYLRGLLAPNGILLTIEGTENSRIQMITVALLESFGRFQDRRQKVNLPLMSPDEWASCASDTGYIRFAAFPEKGSAFNGLPQHVMVAQGPAELRLFDVDSLALTLSASLPGYMIPHHFVVLDELPLSANGKLDHKALPSPWRHDHVGSRKAPPRNDMERRLATIWREALNIEEIGVDDNFFELGGDSLIAVQIVGSIQREFVFEEGVHGSLLQHLFEKQTIAGLASVIESSPAEFTITDGEPKIGDKERAMRE